jgi:hypothetical protein
MSPCIIIFALKLMPEGIVFKFIKHIKRQWFFSVLFCYFEISGDFQGIFGEEKTPTS